MKLPASVFTSAIAVATLLIVLALFPVGCSLLESPTASTNDQNEVSDLWNPQPGDQIVPGHEVPILNQDFWQSSTGQEVNPWRGLVGNLLTPIYEVVGGLGGMVQLGLHSYAIPAGAVNTPTMFSLAYASATGIAVDCGPSPFTFNTPVTLSLSYAGTQYDNDNPPPALQIFYMAPDGTLTPLLSTGNPGLKTVTAQVDHFSRYIVG